MAQVPQKDLNKHLIAIIIGLLLVLIGVSWYFYRLTTSAVVSQTPASSMAGMNMSGDTARRFSVSFVPSNNPTPGQDVTLKFKVYDAANGSPVTNYDLLFTKLIHLVITDGSLQFYNHIHPVLNGSEFSITTKFPTANVYHLYLNFQPTGGTEQQFAFTLPVGTSVPTIPSPALSALTKTFGDLTVTLGASDGKAFNAAAMSDAAQVLNFNFTDTKTGQPITDLQPYLGAFGHLTLINEQTYNYVHVHPIASDNPNLGGPDVKFLPAALFEKITPGIYRVFGQFQRNNQLFVADYTIKVE